ncbi:uncharacterized protein LY79DRAFT_559649 [Colletotrichum navitas]|uniref:Uncharacterized protein n=1 Tax=Colletotrichum navitas TaxID=681940 RepID=A0AAD8PUX4_9PEZI|nr:uncharacterized protein LY79DRAFT_559649 [Colletotrichum navitas]KAK1585071.1 hypothetical protein LY79DRAFT_559649 [Colletotrichum navitas]
MPHPHTRTRPRTGAGTSIESLPAISRAIQAAMPRCVRPPPSFQATAPPGCRTCKGSCRQR